MYKKITIFIISFFTTFSVVSLVSGQNLGDAGIYDFFKYNWTTGLGYFNTGVSQWKVGDVTTSTSADFEVENTIAANEYCINLSSPDCISSWPTGSGGGSNWSFFDATTITPTSTGIGIVVASSTLGRINLNGDIYFQHNSQKPYIKGSGSIGNLELSYDNGTNYLRISENDLRTSLPWGTNVWPRTNNTYSLGTTALQWSNVYATNLFGNISSTTVSVVSKTTDYTATVSDYIVQMDTTAGNATTTLPSAAAVPGHSYILKKISADTNIYGVEPAGVETIDGAIGKQIKFQWSAMKITSDGLNWIID